MSFLSSLARADEPIKYDLVVAAVDRNKKFPEEEKFNEALKRIKCPHKCAATFVRNQEREKRDFYGEVIVIISPGVRRIGHFIAQFSRMRTMGRIGSSSNHATLSFSGSVGENGAKEQKMKPSEFKYEVAMDILGIEDNGDDGYKFWPLDGREYIQCIKVGVDVVLRAAVESGMDLDYNRVPGPTLRWLKENGDMIRYCEGYIITDRGDDPSLTIDGIYVSEQDLKKVFDAIRKASFGKPDEIEICSVDGQPFIRMWWE